MKNISAFTRLIYDTIHRFMAVRKGCPSSEVIRQRTDLKRHLEAVGDPEVDYCNPISPVNR